MACQQGQHKAVKLLHTMTACQLKKRLKRCCTHLKSTKTNPTPPHIIWMCAKSGAEFLKSSIELCYVLLLQRKTDLTWKDEILLIVGAFMLIQQILLLSERVSKFRFSS